MRSRHVRFRLVWWQFMKKELNKIDIESDVNVLLLGNGINRAFQKGSWDELLVEIESAEFNKVQRNALKKLPYPLIPVICTENNVDESLDYISRKLIEEQVSDEQANLYNRLIQNGHHAILTTNYTYDIEKSLCKGFVIKSKKGCKYRYNSGVGKASETEKMLYKYFFLDENYPTIWHIHGEAALPKTMILGAYGYVSISSAIRNYANNTLRRYKGCATYKSEFVPYSWVDYFLMGNIDIVGFGLDISEIDLWWLIEYKKKHNFPGEIVVYDTGKKLEWKMLAEAYGIKYKQYDVCGNDYKGMYEQIICDLNKR